VRKGGNILCNFYITFNDTSFPSDPWLDFPVIVLDWWLEGYLTLRRTGRSVENSFMNGPFEFTSEMKGEIIKLIFRQRTAKGTKEVGESIELTLKEYENELIRVAELLLDVLDRLLVSGRDLDNLRANLALVRSI